MTEGSRKCVRIVAAVIVVIGLMAAGTNHVAQADDDGRSKVIPRDEIAYGNSYGEWGARYWQWVLSIPAARNPGSDTTGAHCGEGQAGPVWYLGSTFGGAAVTRDCTVPAGKAIFFPLATVIAGAGAFDCDPTVPGVACNLAILRMVAGAATDAVRLEARLDGKRLRHLHDQRVQTPVFTLTYPADNVFGAPPGTNTPNVADGYWVMLAPLRIGAHTLYSRAEFTDGIFAGVVIETATHLTIVP